MTHWAQKFPANGVAWVFTQRIGGYIATLESQNPTAAANDMRGWRGSLDFTGVPPDVLDETARLIGDAMSFAKGRDYALAVGRLQDVLKLWGG